MVPPVPVVSENVETLELIEQPNTEADTIAISSDNSALKVQFIDELKSQFSEMSPLDGLPILDALAHAYQQEKKFEQAETTWLYALMMRQRETPQNLNAIVKNLNCLALLCSAQGLTKKSGKYIEQSTKIMLAMTDRSTIGHSSRFTYYNGITDFREPYESYDYDYEYGIEKRDYDEESSEMNNYDDGHP